MKTFKIGVFGSAAGGEVEKAKKQAEKIGLQLAKNNCIVITGACSGIPYAAADIAANRGAKVWGFSPEKNLAGQKKFTPDDDISIYAKLFFIPKNIQQAPDQARKKYRNVSSTSNCNGAIIIAGRWGTLNEFTNLKDMGKVIGVLTGTGGIADQLQKLDQLIDKPGKAKVFFNNSPEKLVADVIKELKIRSEK